MNRVLKEWALYWSSGTEGRYPQLSLEYMAILAVKGQEEKTLPLGWEIE